MKEIKTFLVIKRFLRITGMILLPSSGSSYRHFPSWPIWKLGNHSGPMTFWKVVLQKISKNCVTYICPKDATLGGVIFFAQFLKHTFWRLAAKMKPFWTRVLYTCRNQTPRSFEPQKLWFFTCLHLTFRLVISRSSRCVKSYPSANISRKSRWIYKVYDGFVSESLWWMYDWPKGTKLLFSVILECFHAVEVKRVFLPLTARC